MYKCIFLYWQLISFKKIAYIVTRLFALDHGNALFMDVKDL